MMHASRVPASVALLTLVGCFGVRTYDPTLRESGPEPLPVRDETEYLKVHTSSGELYVLSSWTDPTPDGRFTGEGWLYDLDRQPVELRSDWAFEPVDIALLETNRPGTASRFGLSSLVTYSVLAGVTTGLCLADPKSCFGSCPTFYGDDEERPVAEGFSRSFARALEERDVDDLGIEAPAGVFSLLMRNEALETHAVRHARLIAVPVERGYAIAAGPDGAFRATGNPMEPLSCSSPDGDCLPAVVSRDDAEYAPPTNGEDLGSREEVILGFPSTKGSVGLLLTARQSFVATFLFYQGLAYAGSSLGELLASLERGDPLARAGALGVPAALGNIDVQAREGSGPWTPIGSFDEAGPIAADTRLLPFQTRGSGPLQLRLLMARGAWRVDRVAVATIEPASSARVLEPDSLVAANRDTSALTQLLDPDRYLVTTPGARIRLWYTLPPGAERYALFLDTRGYYYEWMRDTWLPEENEGAARLMLVEPRKALRELAPAFKRIEPRIEELFWSSRFRGDR